MEAHERIGVVRGDVLDLDAALGREHEERLLGATVERDREVVLLRDLGGGLDPHLLDDVAADVEPDDLLRLLLGVGGILGELDATRFPRPPVSTWALTTVCPPSSSAAARASAGVVAMRPSETGMPNCLKSCLPWYS